MGQVIDFFKGAVKVGKEQVRPHAVGFLRELGLNPNTLYVSSFYALTLFNQDCGKNVSPATAIKNYDGLIESLGGEIKSIRQQYHIDFGTKEIPDLLMAMCLDRNHIRKIQKSFIANRYPKIIIACDQIDGFLNLQAPKQLDFDSMNPIQKFVITNTLTARCRAYMSMVDDQFRSNYHYDAAALNASKDSLVPFIKIDFSNNTKGTVGSYLNIWFQHVQRTLRPKATPRQNSTMALTPTS